MTAGRRRPAWWKLVLCGGLLGLVALFAGGLQRDPSFIPSTRIDKPAPNFTLPRMADALPVALEDFRGRRVIVNFWASWCIACIGEHDTLLALGRDLADDPTVTVLGINYKDKPAAAARYLERYGSFPYPSLVDARGRVGIDYGVYGLPETFFIDADGRVVGKVAGPLQPDSLRAELARLGVVR